MSERGNKRSRILAPGARSPETAVFLDAGVRNDNGGAGFAQRLRNNLTRRVNVLEFPFNSVLLVLLWKNVCLLTIKRHYVVTLFHIAAPSALLIMLAINSPSSSETADKTSFAISGTWNETEMAVLLKAEIECSTCLVAYTPDTDFTRSIVKTFHRMYRDELNVQDELKEWKGFNSELEIEASWHSLLQNGSTELKAAIIFEEGFNVSTNGDFADNHNFSYTIRVPVGKQFVVAFPLKLLLNKVLTVLLTKVTPLKEKITLQGYHHFDTTSKIIREFVPYLLSLGSVFIVPAVVSPIVREEKSGIRDLMQVHGLSYGINWLGWLMYSLILQVISGAGFLAILFIRMNFADDGILKLGCLWLWGTTLLMYCILAASWCIFVSSLSDNAVATVWVGALYWLFGILNVDLIRGWILLPHFFPSSSLIICIKLLLEHDVKDFFPVGIVLLQMLVISISYNMVAWFFKSITTSKLGNGKPWNFVFKHSFWTRHTSQISSEHAGEVKIDGLKMVFGDKKVFDLTRSSHTFEWQKITVLYGINGSGKSTLLSVLAGLLPPTSGTAFVNGFDVTKDTYSIRKHLGYCPQRNLLFTDLTVEEHLVFFGMLKGSSRREANLITKDLLTSLHLEGHKDKLSSCLSEGQKRKLNVAMAAIGTPKILLLDEPTSGVDSQSRSSIRKYLLRKECTILMTSHLEEDGAERECAVLRGGNLFFEIPLKREDLSSPLSIKTEEVITRGFESRDKLTGSGLVFPHFCALVWKRCLWTYRNIHVPIISIMLVLIIIYLGGTYDYRDARPQAIELAGIKESVILYSTNNDTRETWNNFTSLRSYSAQEVHNVTEALIEVFQREKEGNSYRSLVALEFGISGINAMFSETESIAIPLTALNLASNAILKRNNGARPQHINGTVNFLKRKWTAFDAADPSPGFLFKTAFKVAWLYSNALIILPAMFAAMPMIEKESGVKQLQLMTGLNAAFYWGASFVCDFIVTIIVSGVLVLHSRSLWTYDSLTDTTGEEVLLLVLMTYGFAATFFSYLVSRKFLGPMTLFGLLAGAHILSVEAGFTTRALRNDAGWVSTELLTIIFLRLFPPYGLYSSIFVFSKIATLNSRCRSIPRTGLDFLCNPNNTIDPKYRSCCSQCQTHFPDTLCFKPQPFIQWASVPGAVHADMLGTGIGFELMWMFAVGFVYMLVLALVESKTLWRIQRAFSKLPNPLPTFRNFQQGGPSVANSQGSRAKDGVEVKEISKSYGSVDAVSGLSFHVPTKKCLGLLGRNGAGKSTLFRIISGEELPSKGNVYIDGTGLANRSCEFKLLSRECSSKIGYCPQFGGLMGDLTGRETLEFFARLWGWRWCETSRIASDWLDRLDLREVENELCKYWSKGLERRLSVAIALIGDPAVVILDEPTAEVDPDGRQRILNVIKECGKTVIISTHELNDCETIFSHLAILQNGRLMGTGSVVDIKNKNRDRIEVSGKHLASKIPELELDCIIRELGGAVETAWINEKRETSAWILHPRAAVGRPYREKLKGKLRRSLKIHGCCFTIMEDEKTLDSIYRAYTNENIRLTLNEHESLKGEIPSSDDETLEKQRDLIKQKYGHVMDQTTPIEFKVPSSSTMSESFEAGCSLFVKISNYLMSDIPQPQVCIYDGESKHDRKQISGRTAEWFGIEGNGSKCCLLLIAGLCKAPSVKLAAELYTYKEGDISFRIALTTGETQIDDADKETLFSSTTVANTWSSGLSTNTTEGYITHNGFIAKVSMEPGPHCKVHVEVLDLHEVGEIGYPMSRSSVDIQWESLQRQYPRDGILDVGKTNFCLPKQPDQEGRTLEVKLANYMRSTLTIQGRQGYGDDLCVIPDLSIEAENWTSRQFRFLSGPGLQLLLSLGVVDGSSLIIFVKNKFDKGVTLIGGFCPADAPVPRLPRHYDTEDVIRSLPFVTEPCHEGFESFVRHDGLLARVYLADTDEPYSHELHIDVVDTLPERDDTRGTRTLANRKKLSPNVVKLNGNISCHYFLLHKILDSLDPDECPYASIIDLENRLHVSLQNDKGIIFLSLQDVEVPRKRVQPPEEVLPFTRETFYESGLTSVQAMFSYEIESTNLSLVIAFEVQGDNNSFAMAIVPSPAEVNMLDFDSMMRSTEVETRLYKNYGIARDGEKTAKNGNIEVRVSMTAGRRSILTICIYKV